jgi:hypothetical protein
MFKAANAFSGISQGILPTELIPLNSTQLARGLLNFTVLQSLEDWILPYWAEQQYSPDNPAFVPRSHLGISMNITHRNWTAVGNPGCRVEPIVDPRGLVTPGLDGWSIDCWLASGDEVLFPSRHHGVKQELVGNDPIVKTAAGLGSLELTSTAWTVGSRLYQKAVVKNSARAMREARLAIALRPFNPEGVSLVHDIAYDSEGAFFLVNRSRKLLINADPDRVLCRSYREGDSAQAFVTGKIDDGRTATHCDSGLATALAEFRLELGPGESRSIEWAVDLADSPGRALPVSQPPAISAEYWRGLLESGSRIVTPDTRVNDALQRNLVTLLMFCDGNIITPGPFTYHQFWFRDASIMLHALDAFGYHDFTRPILNSFTSRQESDGFYRSQQGEWDSNGQALWCFWNHAVLSGNSDVLSTHFGSLRRGARWIEMKRHGGGKGHEGAPPGLLPPGLSAEHLGMSDCYYWDNFWSVAGLKAFARVCEAVGANEEKAWVTGVCENYRRDIEQALAAGQTALGTVAIPAGPLRGFDSGMIGSLSAAYPLQIFGPDDPRIAASLDLLKKKFFHQGMFNQKFIHSGLNAYLTLHVARCHLFLGERDEFQRIFSSVLGRATATGTFPEAIHPLTGGGCMGDGHHGWAAAEVALAVRAMFVSELEAAPGSTSTLVLLGGIPKEWINPGSRWTVERLAVPGGSLSMTYARTSRSGVLTIDMQPSELFAAPELEVRFPAGDIVIRDQSGSLLPSRPVKRETRFFVPAGSSHLTIAFK